MSNAVQAISPDSDDTTGLMSELATGPIPSMPEEKLSGFLMDERDWLLENPLQLQSYAYGLLEKLDHQNFGEYQSGGGLQQLIYRIITELGLGRRQEISVLDPTYGYGVLLSGLAKVLPQTKVSLSGQEINTGTYEIAKKLLSLSGVDADIRFADLLSKDAFEGETFDLVLLDAPLGMNWDKKRLNLDDPRFGFGHPRQSDAGLLFIQAGLAKLKPASQGGGYLVAVTTRSNLAGVGPQQGILAEFVDRDLVHTVIRLPSGIHHATSVPLYLVVFTNRKEAKWTNKIQLVDASAEFDEVPGTGEKRVTVSKHGLEQISQALITPKPSNLVRTLTPQDLLLRKCKVIYPDAQASIWAKDGLEKNASCTITSGLGGVSESSMIESNLVLGVGAVEFQQMQSYISFEVEPRFTSTGRARISLDHALTDVVSLMRLTSNVLVLSKANSARFNELAQEYLAIPRDPHGECLHVRAGEVPQTLSTYTYLSLHDASRISSHASWLNTRQGKLLREEIWKQVTSRSRFMPGMVKEGEIIEFLAYLRVPFLDSAQMNRLAGADLQIDQIITVLRNMKDEIWLDESVISSVRDLTGALNGQETLRAWAEQLPFPLAASLRTYEAFNLDQAKASEQLIHFWEATATFHATYLLSALKQSDDLWNREIPKLREALSNGHCSFDRATLGTWRITIEYLSKRFLSMLNSDEEPQRDKAINLLGGASHRTLERLLSPKISQLLGQVNEFRNRYDGHSGTMSIDHYREKKEGLLLITNELKSELGNAWSEMRLLRPGAQHNLDDGTFTDCEILMGPTDIFISEQVKVNGNLLKGSLYLLSDAGSVKLAPFIQMSSTPSEVMNTCYFYNRKETDGVRMVAYHLAMQNESKDGSNELGALLDEMRNLTVSPLAAL
jgi:hypothetical protein